MGSDIVGNVQTLMLVSTEVKNYIFSVVQYVSKLVVSKSLMLYLFTGVKHLEIYRPNYGDSISLSSFDKNSLELSNIWKNLDILVMPYEIAEELNEYPASNPEKSTYFLGAAYYSILDCFLNQDNSSLGSSYFLNQDNSSLNNSCSIEYCLTSNPEKPRYFMPNLRSLEIMSGVRQHGIFLDPDVFPNLRSLDIDRFMIKNVGEFKRLEKLVITGTDVELHRLNDLNITELRLIEVDDEFRNLNIPSLRSLTVEGGYVDTHTINDLNITELRLLNIDLDDRDPMFSIPNLRILVIRDVWANLDILNNLNLTVLKLIFVKHLENSVLNIPSLISLELDCMKDVQIDELPNLEILMLTESSISLKKSKMPKLLNLSITSLKTANTGLEINSLTCPRLRYLNIAGKTDENLIRLKPNLHLSHDLLVEDMLDIIVIRNPCPIIYRWDEDRLSEESEEYYHDQSSEELD